MACWDETFAGTNSLSEKYKFGDLRWDYATEEGLLLFSQSGVTTIRAATQVAGSTQDGSWEWSWANPNLPDIGRWRISEVRGFGDQQLCPVHRSFIAMSGSSAQAGPVPLFPRSLLFCSLFPDASGVFVPPIPEESSGW